MLGGCADALLSHRPAALSYRPGMDTLSEFLARIRLQGRLFFAGTVHRTLQLDKPPGMAFIHIAPNGGLELAQPGVPRIEVDAPSVLFCPSSCRYDIRPVTPGACELVCASFRFLRESAPHMALGLTETLIFPIADLGPAAGVVQALIGEFRQEGPGRSRALELLFDYLLVLLVRRAVADGAISTGLLYALSDARLSCALEAMHRAPETAWTVEALARHAGMSRSRFADRFGSVLGVSPIQYLTGWRMKVAQDLLCEGVPIKVVASSVGYGSQAAFTRVFQNMVGQPPGEWLKQAARADIDTPPAR